MKLLKMICCFLLVCAVLFVFLPFSPRLFLCFYEKCYSSTQISLSDFLNYSSNVFIGVMGIILSSLALHISNQNEKISIETSKSIIQDFLEISYSGFKKNHEEGENFRYYRTNRNEFACHLRRLKIEDVLSDEDVDLCREINMCVRQLKDDFKNDVEKAQQNDKISKLYKAFGDEHTFKDKIDKVLEKL